LVLIDKSIKTEWILSAKEKYLQKYNLLPLDYTVRIGEGTSSLHYN